MLPHGGAPGGHAADDEHREVQREAEHGQRDAHAAEALARAGRPAGDPATGRCRRRRAGAAVPPDARRPTAAGTRACDRLAGGAAQQAVLDRVQQHREDVDRERRVEQHVAEVAEGGVDAHQEPPSRDRGSSTRSSARGRVELLAVAGLVGASESTDLHDSTTVRRRRRAVVGRAGEARTQNRRRLTVSDSVIPTSSATAAREHRLLRRVVRDLQVDPLLDGVEAHLGAVVERDRAARASCSRGRPAPAGPGRPSTGRCRRSTGPCRSRGRGRRGRRRRPPRGSSARGRSRSRGRRRSRSGANRPVIAIWVRRRCASSVTPGRSNFVAPWERNVVWSTGSHCVDSVRCSPPGKVTVNCGA